MENLLHALGRLQLYHWHFRRRIHFAEVVQLKVSRSAVRKFHCSTPAKFSYNLQIPICLNCTQGDSVNYYPSFLEDKRYVYFCLSFVKCREMCGSWLNICMWHIHQKQHLGLRDQEENQICCQSLEVLARAYENQLNVIDYLHQRICLFCNFQF